jgi:hypothetical protein
MSTNCTLNIHVVKTGNALVALSPFVSVVACTDGLDNGEALDFIKWLSRIGDCMIKERVQAHGYFLLVRRSIMV